MLKSWAVKRLEGVLADYLEDVSPDAVRGSLGKDTGTLKLNARLKRSALEPFHLDLIDSELKVDVKIPWRHIYTEHTVVKVGLKIEVQMTQTKGSGIVDEARRKARKDEEIAKLVAQKIASATGPAASAGMVAQTSHVILRQLVVQIEGLQGVIRRERAGAPTMQLGLARARLESVASDWVSPPKEDQADLYKALDITGLSVALEGGANMLWPLSVEARLHHSPAEGLAHLRLSMPPDSPLALEVTPTSLQFVRGCLDWYMECAAAAAEATSGGSLPSGAGREYALEYSRKLRGEAHNGQKLLEIEELGSAAWIVEWRAWCKTQKANQEMGATEKPSWWDWATGKTVEGSQAVQGDEFLVSLLDRAEQGGALPSVAPPTKVELEVRIPKAELCFLGCKDLDQKLTITAKETSGTLKAHAEAASESTEEAVHLWQATALVDLTSFMVHLDEALIFEVRKTDPVADDQTSLVDLANLPADVRAAVTAAGEVPGSECTPKCLTVSIMARQRGTVSAAQAGWDLALIVRKEPIILHLAPWTVHGVVAMAMEMMKSVTDPDEKTVHDRRISYEIAPQVEELPSNTVQDGELEESMVSALKGASLFIKLDVVLKAPIVNFQLPQHGTRLTAHLGSFYAITGNTKGGEAEFMPIAALCILCELKDTRLAFSLHSKDEVPVFQPSTVALVADARASDGPTKVSLSAASLSVRLDPGFSRALGQLKLGMEYALLPVTSVAAAEVGAPALQRAVSPSRAEAVVREAVVRTLVPEVSTNEVASLQVSVELGYAEVVWGLTRDTHTICGRYEDALVTFESYSQWSTCRICSTRIAFESGGVAVIETTGALDVRIQSLPDMIDIHVGVPCIGAQWIGTSVMELFSAGRSISEGMSKGEEEARKMLPPGGDQGMALRLWNKYVHELSTQLQANLTSQLGNYGLTGESNEVAVQKEQTTARSIRVGVACKQVDLSLRQVGNTKEFPDVAIDAKILAGTFDYKGSGMLDVSVALASVDIILQERLLLARRNADTELLRVKVHAEPAPVSSTSVDLTWAQVAVVYRQRDMDAVARLIMTEVVEVVSPSQKPLGEDTAPPHAVTEENVATMEEESGPMRQGEKAEARSNFTYALSVAAPLVFLPTDESSSFAGGGRLHSNGEGSICEYQAPLGEGYAEIDFGHFNLRQGEQPGEVVCDLQQVQAFNHIHDAREPGIAYLRKLEVLHPLSFNLRIVIKDGSFEVVVDVILKGSAEDVGPPQITLTRAQVTQWIDIIFLNITYQVAQAQATPGTELEEAPQPKGTTVTPTLATAERGKESAQESASKPFRIAVRWTGRARLATFFTEDSPIASLDLDDGFLDLRGLENGSISVEVGCKSGGITDTRLVSRNANRRLVECSEQAEWDTALHVSVLLPRPVHEAVDVKVELRRPVIMAFPRLLMDLMTWALSTFQQSAQGRASAAQIKPSASRSSMQSASVDKSSSAGAQQHIEVVVNIHGAGLCLASDWAELDNYFELSGDLVVKLKMAGDILYIENIGVEGGRLRRTSAEGLLCSRWECEVKGSFENVVHYAEEDKLGKLDLDMIKVPPLRIRLSVQDHVLLLQALTILGLMESDSAEPAEEIRARDPLAFNFRSRFQVKVVVQVQGLELQMIDDEMQQTVRPAIEVALSCPLFAAAVETGGELVVPKVTCATKPMAWLRVRSYNERVGEWEPVLQYASWAFELQVQEDKKARQAQVALKLSSTPIHVIVTSAFTHLVARLAPALSGESASGGEVGRGGCYSEMLVAVNLCGRTCSVTTSTGSARVNLPPAGEKVSLEPLLVDADRLLLPELCVSIPGIDGSRTMQLVRENSEEWDIGCGKLLLHVVMPKPPQRLLVLSSPLVLTNQLDVDVEVLYMGDTGSLDITGQKDSQRWAQAALLDEGYHGVERSLSFRKTSASSSRLDLKECTHNADLLPAGCVLSAPLGMNVHRLKVRPMPAGGMEYNWSKELDYKMIDAYRAEVPLCCQARSATFHMSMSPLADKDTALDTLFQLSLEAPFYIANACPCEIICIFRDNMQAKNWESCGNTSVRVEAELTSVTVYDGFGKSYKVAPNHKTEIFVLNAGGEAVCWKANKGEEKELKLWSAVSQATGLQVARSGRSVTFTFYKHTSFGTGPGVGEMIIQPGKASPVVDRALEQTHVVLLLRQLSGGRTMCSRPVPLFAITEEFSCRVECGHALAPVILGVKGGIGRSVVVFAQLWFVDSTGLDVHLSADAQGRGRGRLDMPMFGEGMVLACAEESQEETCFYLRVMDFDPVKVAVPSPGTSAKVQLSRIHECVVQTEAIAASETFGAPCHLFSVVPAVMAFSYVPGTCIGVRQECAQDVKWLSNGESASIWWLNQNSGKRVEVAATCQPERRGAVLSEVHWSAPFELGEAAIGSFPIVLLDGSGSRVLVCVQVDQSGSLFTVTVRDASYCYQLVNRHPCLKLDACFVYGEQDRKEPQTIANFLCEHGAQVPFGRPCKRWNEEAKLCLTLSDSGQSSELVLDLTRTGSHLVKNSDEFKVSAVVFVELRGTVARVTVENRGFIAGTQEELDWVTTFDVLLPRITVSVVGEASSSSKRPREEVLTVVLGELRTSIEQHGTKFRDVIFNLKEMQVTLQRPQPEVILSSVQTPCLLAQTTREDLVSRVMSYRRIRVDLGRMELFLSEDVMWEIQQLTNDLIPTLGLERDKVLARAGVEYHMCCHGPLEPKPMMALDKVDIGEICINIWCNLQLHRLPSVAYTVVRFTTLGCRCLQADGVKIKLDPQSPFDREYKGSVGAMGMHMLSTYRPLVVKSIGSLVFNSNLAFGGLLSRHYWRPKSRKGGCPAAATLKLVGGKVPSRSSGFQLSGVHLQEVEIAWGGEVIRQMQFVYSNGERDIVGGETSYRRQESTFILHQNEQLTVLKWTRSGACVDGVAFVTSQGRESSWFGPRSTPVSKVHSKSASTRSQIWSISWSGQIEGDKGMRKGFSIDALVERSTEDLDDYLVPCTEVSTLEAPALVPSLNEEGYKQAASSGNLDESVEETKHFIRRVARTMGLEVVNEGDLSGFARHYSGSAVRDLRTMRNELADLSQRVPWIQRSHAGSSQQPDALVERRVQPKQELCAI